MAQGVYELLRSTPVTLSLSHRSRKPYRASILLELTNVAQISGQCPGNWLMWLASKGWASARNRIAEAEMGHAPM